MTFQTEAHRACYEKVESYLREMFGELVAAHPHAPVFMTYPMGSAVAHILIDPWGDDDATIVVRAYVVHGAEMTPDLMSYLLHENHKMRFGAFGLDDDNDIFFEHTIVGSTCDRNELRASVLAVLTTADRYDDEIRSRWGGERALDRLTR